MEGGAVIAIVLVVVAVAVIATAAQKARKRAGFHALGPLFDGPATVSEEASSVTGEIDGQRVTVRFTMRGSGSNSTSWTEVDVTHGVIDVDLALRPHGWSEDHAIAAGRAIDLQTGHPAFDDRFVVEAAPADVVLAALDGPTREALLALDASCDVVTPAAGQLQIGQRGWLTDLSVSRPLVGAAVRLGTALRAARSEIGHGDRGASAYRDAPDARGEARRRAELEALRALRAERSAHQVRVGVVAVVLLVGLVLIFALWSGFE
ncbi:MAG: hypothetical protein KF729_09275 [Sandaracinaceae bacterium]|nr:hypothetical protein [Sandaracinaceae bacterium]